MVGKLFFENPRKIRLKSISDSLMHFWMAIYFNSNVFLAQRLDLKIRKHDEIVESLKILTYSVELLTV